MAHIVIIGASTGGLPAAYECRAALDKTHHISVVSNTPIFHFVPSNPWVAVGWRKREDISFKLASVLSSKNIDFLDLLMRNIYFNILVRFRCIYTIEFRKIQSQNLKNEKIMRNFVFYIFPK